MTPNQWRVANKCPYLEKVDYLWYDVNRVTVTRRNGEYKGELQMRISYNKLQKLMIDNQMQRYHHLLRRNWIRTKQYLLMSWWEFVKCSIVILGIYVKLYWTNRRNIASGKKIKLDIKRLNVHQKGELDGRRNI